MPLYPYVPTPFNIVTKTTTYTVTAADYIVLCDTSGGGYTVNLPTAVGIPGREYVIKNIGSKVLTIDANASETIDGSVTEKLNTQYSSINIISDNSNWIII